MPKASAREFHQTQNASLQESPPGEPDHGQSIGLGAPDYIAAMVAFLFSDDVAYINGQTILVDGGANLT
jgi:NAD(P)-dependent dehydrogenase (short-subunit alcohol dehydrogenase family)